jgi:hypothetical protein
MTGHAGPGMIALIGNALVMPLRGTLDRFLGGVFQDGRCLEQSLLYRHGQLFGLPAGPAEVAAALADPATDRLEGDYLFGGYLFRHYGHFLIETLSRLYALQAADPGLPVIFSSTHRAVMPWQKALFRLLGLRGGIVLLTRPTLVERLILAAPGFILPDTALPEQIRALGTVPAPPLTGRKVWLSRGMHIGGGLVNERELFPGLQKKGWEIVDPQFLPVRRQIELLACCAHVAGLDGSAFHTALLAREIRGVFHIFFLRSAGVPYTSIARFKGFAQREIFLADRATFLLGQGAERFFRLDDPNSVTEALP